MAYTTAEPIILSQVNHWEFLNAHVLTADSTIVLDCRRGYRNPESGTVTPYDITSCSVSGAGYAAALGQTIQNGATLGEAVVAAAYALLIATGTIPGDASEV